MLSEIFRSQTVARILEVLLSRPDEFFTLSRLAKETGLSISTLSSNMRHLEKLGIVRHVGSSNAKVKLYRLNHDSPLTQALLEFYRRLSRLEDRQGSQSS